MLSFIEGTINILTKADADTKAYVLNKTHGTRAQIQHPCQIKRSVAPIGATLFCFIKYVAQAF